MDEAPDSHGEEVEHLALKRVGAVLRGKWRLDRLLGVGGFAAVYEATHRAGKRVAVKVLHREHAGSGDARQRFLREARAVNLVEHPGVVSVDDDDVTEDGAVFLVMELLDGETAEARRERLGGRLPAVEVLSIADQMLDVLQAAHAKDIVHRDIKPDNLFIARTGRVRVLDFGIARVRQVQVQGRGTQTGALMGTPAFMAPEHARGIWQDVDARTDLWEVGATLFVLLSGRPVHEGRTMTEVLAAAVTLPARSLATVAPEVPAVVVELVDRALAFEKEKRFQNAGEMQEAVRKAYQRMMGAPVSSAPRLSVPAARDPNAAPTLRLDPPGSAWGASVPTARDPDEAATSPMHRDEPAGARGGGTVRTGDGPSEEGSEGNAPGAEPRVPGAPSPNPPTLQSAGAPAQSAIDPSMRLGGTSLGPVASDPPQRGGSLPRRARLGAAAAIGAAAACAGAIGVLVWSGARGKDGEPASAASRDAPATGGPATSGSLASTAVAPVVTPAPSASGADAGSAVAAAPAVAVVATSPRPPGTRAGTSTSTGPRPPGTSTSTGAASGGPSGWPRGSDAAPEATATDDRERSRK